MLPTWCVKPLNELVWCIISPRSMFQDIANFKETTAISIRNWLTIFPTIDGLAGNANQAPNAFLRKARCCFDPANGVEMWWTRVRCRVLLFRGLRLFSRLSESTTRGQHLSGLPNPITTGQLAWSAEREREWGLGDVINAVPRFLLSVTK